MRAVVKQGKRIADRRRKSTEPGRADRAVEGHIARDIDLPKAAQAEIKRTARRDEIPIETEGSFQRIDRTGIGEDNADGGGARPQRLAKDRGLLKNSLPAQYSQAMFALVWMSQSPPARLYIFPRSVLVLLYSARLAGPVIVTVPSLVSTLSKLTFPLMVSTPPPAMVRGTPLKVLPDQLNNPLIVTELVKLIVPLVKLMVSVDAGTPGRSPIGLIKPIAGNRAIPSERGCGTPAGFQQDRQTKQNGCGNMPLHSTRIPMPVS